MKRLLPAAAVLVLGLALALTGSARGQSQAELTRLRVLLVIDTNSSLKESVEFDRFRLTQMLENAIPPSRRTITVLDGDKVTKDNILGHYRDLKTSPDEALFLYYCGHGAMDPQKGRFFALQKIKTGKIEPVFRADIRRAMEAKGAGLV